jgi:thioredoxin-like negative regulator of GroEL
VTAREEFIAKVKEGGDDELVEVAAWLYDLRESDPAEYRRALAEVYVRIGEVDKARALYGEGPEEAQPKE